MAQLCYSQTTGLAGIADCYSFVFSFANGCCLLLGSVPRLRQPPTATVTYLHRKPRDASGIAFDHAGQCLVTECSEDVVIALSPNGQTIITQFGKDPSWRSTTDQPIFQRPFGVYVDALGRILVCGFNKIVYVFAFD